MSYGGISKAWVWLWGTNSESEWVRPITDRLLISWPPKEGKAGRPASTYCVCVFWGLYHQPLNQYPLGDPRQCYIVFAYCHGLFTVKELYLGQLYLTFPSDFWKWTWWLIVCGFGGMSRKVKTKNSCLSLPSPPSQPPHERSCWYS